LAKAFTAQIHKRDFDAEMADCF
jgi:hypothetical protein